MSIISNSHNSLDQYLMKCRVLTRVRKIIIKITINIKATVNSINKYLIRGSAAENLFLPYSALSSWDILVNNRMKSAHYNDIHHSAVCQQLLCSWRHNG